MTEVKLLDISNLGNTNVFWILIKTHFLFYRKMRFCQLGTKIL